MKPIMKTNALIIFCLTMLSFSGCQDEGKARLEPPEIPEMVDSEEGKSDYVSYFTDVVGEFKYYGETLLGDFIPNGFTGYKFTGKRDEVVSIELTALTHGRDTVLYLYPPVDPDDFWGEIWRSPIAENDDIDWPENTNSAIVDFTLPGDGVYLIVVAEYYGRSGSFSVSLNCTGGGCVPVEPQSRCERLGGYCAYFMDECSAGFTGANESGQALGCEGGRSSMCCVPADPNPYACESSSDCVMAKADCCGCQMGGTSVAINRDFADMAGPDPLICAHIACLAYYNCFGVAHCIDGMCATVAPDGPEAGCIDSGGSIETASCCESAGDFPNTCLIGPCGCAPEYSHDVRVCACPEGQCFDGNKCSYI